MKYLRSSFALISIVFFLILVGCAQPEKKTKNIINSFNESIVKTNNFNDYFKFEKSILLDSNIILNQIWSLDSDTSGNLLITDLLGKHVVIFNSSGVLQKELNTEKCTPGFNWMPLNAKYFQNSIVVLNSGPWGYLFKKDGNCLEEMHPSFIAPLYYAPFGKDEIIGYYGDAKYLLKISDSKGRDIHKFGDIPTKYKNIVKRIAGGGLVVDDENNIYVANVYSPRITKYSSDRKIIDSFFRKPKKYNSIETDIFNEGFYIGKEKMKDKTLTASLNLINPSTIIIELFKSNNFSFEILSTNGKYYNSETINSPGKILLAKDNKLYVLQNINNQNIDKYTNPIINVYSFKY